LPAGTIVVRGDQQAIEIDGNIPRRFGRPRIWL
jgi:hypothetical protein